MVDKIKEIKLNLHKAAEAIINQAALVEENTKLLIIHGKHNKNFAELLALEAFKVGTLPFLWSFDDSLFLNLHSNIKISSKIPEHVKALILNSDTIIWLSQYTHIDMVLENIKEALFSFWGNVYALASQKPALLVNLPSPGQLGEINYDEYLKAFVNAVNVDYEKITCLGDKIAKSLRDANIIVIRDKRGTDLKFSIEGRELGIETGTLRKCLSIGQECVVEIPAGEVYVAPIENSADGKLFVQRTGNIEGLELIFENGRIVNFKAEKREDKFCRLIQEADGDKDRIAEFGIGLNPGVNTLGFSIFDEKAFGSVHIAIGRNIHLGGKNEASIHVDFVIEQPDVFVDSEAIIKNGKIVV
jgi:leucyl aminopeptidase (aminopeptidase T)